MQNCIAVACDKFMGAHKHLPVFGILIMSIALYLGGSITLVPPAKVVTGNMPL